MAKCIACSQTIDDSFKFCGHCGAAVPDVAASRNSEINQEVARIVNEAELAAKRNFNANANLATQSVSGSSAVTSSASRKKDNRTRNVWIIIFVWFLVALLRTNASTGLPVESVEYAMGETIPIAILLYIWLWRDDKRRKKQLDRPRQN